jgi:hypothetical protein
VHLNRQELPFRAAAAAAATRSQPETTLVTLFDHIMLREKVKIGVLLVAVLVCLGSLVTSHKSFQMGPRDLPTLQPQVMQHCKSIHKARDACLDHLKPKQQQECPTAIHQASQCEAAVIKAYRIINMGGCPHQLQDVTLCELERCGGYHGISVLRASSIRKRGDNNNMPLIDGVEGCMHHCDAVRKRLDVCVTENVKKTLQKYGIKVQEG